ncbi:recombinase family protein [Streptomyces sp. NPDC056708]|uniref:recombinase family protein n=1 Tax=unclassified Streptomyces TaxID=2593676 RepID=UPI0036B6767C
MRLWRQVVARWCRVVSRGAERASSRCSRSSTSVNGCTSTRLRKQGPEPIAVPAQRSAKPTRIGYSRTSTARQGPASRLDALRGADCHKIYQEQISTRIKVRPEPAAALTLARQFKEAAPDTPVICAAHELKRLACNAAELMTLSADLPVAGIRLELLTGPLKDIYAPNRMGVMFMAAIYPPAPSTSSAPSRCSRRGIRFPASTL